MSWFRCAAAAVLLIASTAVHAQQSDDVDLGHAVLRGISPLLIPKVIADCALLRNYIRSDEFAVFRAAHGDLSGVDAIFREAYRLSWRNPAEALLISALATFDHRRVGVRLPIVGPLLWLPLTSEFQEEFNERLRALPSKLYPDTPPGIGGDRDKLQHFFGSAFLAYTMEDNDPAERVGDFIEWGEERFIVGGVNDVRDQRSNAQGRRFGLRFREDESIQPSEYMFPTIVRWDDLPPSGCVLDSAFPVREVQ